MCIIGQEGLEQIRVFKRQRTSLQQLVEAIAVFCVCEILKKPQHIHMILALKLFGSCANCFLDFRLYFWIKYFHVLKSPFQK